MMMMMMFKKRSGENSTIRYDTRCYFNVRSKADISQLYLQHGTKLKSGEKEKKLKSENGVSVSVRGIRGVNAEFTS